MTIYDTEAETLRQNFNSAAIFTPLAGATRTLRIEYEERNEDQPRGMDSVIRSTKKVISFLRADLAAEPNLGETFTIGSTIYTVKYIDSKDQWFMTVAVI